MVQLKKGKPFDPAKGKKGRGKYIRDWPHKPDIIRFRVTPELKQLLKAYADDQGVKVSNVVRDAIQEYIKAHGLERFAKPVDDPMQLKLHDNSHENAP